jgi:hypothetical protein
MNGGNGCDPQPPARIGGCALFVNAMTIAGNRRRRAAALVMISPALHWPVA